MHAVSDDESTVATLEYLFKPPESEFTEKMRFNDGKCDPHGRYRGEGRHKFCVECDSNM